MRPNPSGLRLVLVAVALMLVFSIWRDHKRQQDRYDHLVESACGGTSPDEAWGARCRLRFYQPTLRGELTGELTGDFTGRLTGDLTADFR